MLTLDQSTLFYWTLSDTSLQKRQYKDAIKEWASEILASAKPVSQAPSHMTQTTGCLAVPSLTSGTSCSSAPLVLTNDVRIVGHRTQPDLVKVKAETGPEPKLKMALYFDGGLSDHDEMIAKEREAAINSPPKGKKQVINEVS
jgi:hypothetical protein